MGARIADASSPNGGGPRGRGVAQIVRRVPRASPFPGETDTVNVTIDGIVHDAVAGERLIDLINRVGIPVPHVCYHPQLGPIQSCDTCMVESNGELVRA